MGVEGTDLVDRGHRFVILRHSNAAAAQVLASFNAASIALSRSVFPEADETNPPDDAPYVSFALTL